MADQPPRPAASRAEIEKPNPVPAKAAPPAPREVGGPEGPEPTRYGDWEKKGRCVDF